MQGAALMSRFARVIGLGLLVFALWTAQAIAQLNTEQREYYNQWLKDAERAEQVIDANRASTVALEELRRQLALYRQDFLTARDRNSARISTVQSQLDALGPAPEEGKSEPEEVANLRANLNTQLTQFRVPIVVSHEAYNRANGLVSEVDHIIRDRQTRELLAREQSPLNVSLWDEAKQELRDLWESFQNEVSNTIHDAASSGVLLSQAPQVALLVLAALILIVLGRRLMLRVGDLIYARLHRASGRVLSYVVSLSGVMLQILGFVLLETAIHQAGIVGLRGEFLLERLPGWGAQILVLVWLAERVYPKTDAPSLIPLAGAHRRSARTNFWIAGLVLVLFDFEQTILKVDQLSDTTATILGFPVVLLGSLLLLRLHRVSVRERRMRLQEGDDTNRSGLLRIMSALGVMALVVGCAAPVLSIVGFSALAEALVFPALETLVLFAGVLVLQSFFSDVYGWVTGAGDDTSDSLVIALMGFVFAILALPLLALIWGVRSADLYELWRQALKGVSVGGTQVTATDLLSFVVVFGVGYAATRALQSALGNSVLPRTSLDPGGQKAVVSGTGYVGIFLAALVAISTAGIDLSSIALVAGALSVGIGFGLQTIVQNFVSGIILLIERPISEGDWIEVNGSMGYVRNISVRSTRIETFDRTDVIVPNADFISGTVTNYTRGDTVGRLILPVGVAYGTDTRKVDQILREIAEAHPMVLAAPPPSIVFQGFGASSLDFEIRAILRDVNWILSVRTEMNHQIAKRFMEEGIEIPFPQQDLWLRNPESLVSPQDPKGSDA